MKATLLSIGAIAALLLAGCSQEAKNDIATAGDAAATAASKTGEAVATDTAKAGEAVKDAGTAAVEATKDVAQNVGDATLTPKIKTQLLNTSGLETKDVNVETADKTVTLKGSVPDEKQKKMAEDAAKLAAGEGFTIKNELTVAGGAK